MKRLLTACLLIVFLTACLPLGAGLAAAKTDAVPEEFRLMRYAQALYDEISSAYNTAQGYRIAQFNRKEFYRDRLAKADLYNFTYDYFVNISSALFNLGWGFVTGDVKRMTGAVVGMYVDEAYNFVMDSLKATAPMTVKDYIYAQAHSALDAIDLGKIEDVMERAQNNGGKLVSYEDASELVYRHLANKMNFSTLGMASEYYNKQLNEGVDGAIRDLIVKISLSEVAEKVGQSHFITSTLYDSLINFEFEFLDGIGQQCNEPCVSAWVTEQKEILSEYSKFCGETIDHINLQQYSQPSWVTDDAGRWTCVDGEPCELDVIKVGSTSSSLQLYFPDTGRIETAVFAGIDNRHRAVYLDTKNDAVLCTAGNGTELNLWVTLYGSGGGAEQSASFVRQEYAWAGHWVNTENPETVLDITSNGDGTLHLAAKFAPDLAFSFDFEPIDYEILYFDTLEKPFPADMRIDGSTGMLEFFLWPSDDYSLPDWIYKEIPVLSRLDEYAGSYFFTTDNPPDLTKYGWGYHEEPDVLSEEESLRLFAGLSETPLLAASGAGAWEGRIRINADGSFTGYYYDADFETIYEVSFSGRFEPHVETMNSVYWLFVEDLKTAQTPGKTAAGEYGETIIYDEPPFYAGDYLLLTLPGTPNDMIPEMVQSEIGGVFDEWEDYSRFITLTRLTDGWGFFADPADPPSYDGEPVSTAAPTAAPTPVLLPTATPVPTAEPVEKLPKNITRLPGGNLRYDDGLIAFEMEPDALPIVYNIVSSLQIYPEGSIATVVNVAVPSPTEYIDCYDFIYTETQDRYLNSIHVGIVQFPEGTDAAEWVRSYDAKNKKSGYETVAGKTARYVVLQSNTGMAIILYMDKQFNVYKLFRYFIPLSGNGILSLEYYEYADPWRQASLNAVLNSLEIRDSLIFSPPENVPPTPAPTEEPTPVPEEPTAIPTAEPTPVPTEEPTPVPTEEPTPVPTEEPAPAPAETPPPMGLGWVGNWMAHDESMAEMIITDNWNGTLRAQVLCLPAGDIDAALTPVDGSTMLFEHDKGGYNSMLGTLTKREDGTLRLDFTGGEYFEDEEATEYQGYYIGGFTFYPAEYEDMWYQTPEDAASTPEDWLGDWTSRNLDQSSTLRISGSGNQLTVDLTLGSHHYTAPADMDSDTIISVYGDDGFCCMLLLNKKLGRIAMLEVGASSDDVYDLIGSAYYGTVIYDRAIRLPGGSDNLDAVNNVDELPPTLIMPVPTQAPKSSELRPIPGKAGFMQVPASDVGATSYVLGTGDPAAFAPGRMTDGDETTCWQFSTDATKPGQAYIDFDFDSPVTLDEMWMKNGFWKTVDGEDQYVRHSRPKKITIYIRYGGSDAFQKMKTVSLKDDKARKDWKVISMKGVKNVTGVRVRVDEIYKGTKNKTAVCVSEIMFVQAVK